MEGFRTRALTDIRGLKRLLPSLANVLAPALILIMPLVSFLSYHRYELWRPECLISIGAVLLVGLAISAFISLRSELLRPAAIGLLLVLFLDMQLRPRSSDGISFLTGWPFAPETASHVLIGGVGLIAIVSVTLAWILRRHLGTIVSSVFGVMILSTIVLPSAGIPVGETHRNNATGRLNLAPVIHLILDEHIGLAGLPKDVPGGAELRRDLESFYERYGFTVFPRAYSLFSNTFESIPNMLNGEARPWAGAVPKNGFRLPDNRWFRTLAESGYKLRIYQTEFLDYCTPDLAAIEYCLTVPSNSISSLKEATLPVGSKARIILSTHQSGSFSIYLARRLMLPLGGKISTPRQYVEVACPAAALGRGLGFDRYGSDRPGLAQD